MPIAQKYEWDVIKELSKKVAFAFSEKYPGKFTTVMTKAKRKGKIYIDYLRNGRGATSLLPYSTRAKPGTPFCVTLDWKELSRAGSSYSLEDVKKRHKKGFRDPWSDIDAKKGIRAWGKGGNRPF